MLDGIVLEVMLPTSGIEMPMWLWSDQMAFFDGGLTDPLFEGRRSALETQRRVWLGTTPLVQVVPIVDQELLPVGHPYRNAIPGPPEDLRKIHRDDVLAFHRAWYGPEHAILGIVGDITPKDGFALAKRYFGTIPRSPSSGHLERPGPITLQGETQVDVAANVPSSRVVIRWPTARWLTTEDAYLDMVARVLAGHSTARLYWSLVDTKKIATRVDVHQDSCDLGSELQVTIDVSPGHTGAEALAAFDASMKELATTPTASGSVSRAAYETLIGRSVEEESPWTRARQVVTYVALVGQPGYGAHDYDRYNHVPAGAIDAAIARYMPADRRVVLLITPDPRAPVSGEPRARRFTPAQAP
jgi:zinc protease